MALKDRIDRIRSEMGTGMGLVKCRQCGCMDEALSGLRAALPSIQAETPEVAGMPEQLEGWAGQMQPLKYACLGCEHCYAAVGLNLFSRAFPDAVNATLSCEFEVDESVWPPVPGEYHVFCQGLGCPVAVSTLGSSELADALSAAAAVAPGGLCIVGKTETENIGIDKLIKNTVSNPAIHYLVLAGHDPAGHRSGATLLSLWENGVDDRMRVVGSPGKRPILRNVTRDEVEQFRRQVRVVDLIGCEDVGRLVEEIKALASQAIPSVQGARPVQPYHPYNVPVVEAEEPKGVELDRAGYFVIIPEPKKGMIAVEHYSYDNSLQRVIHGKDARSIYSTIIENGWVTQLSHAAYLGKELTRAELSLQTDSRYVQDGA
jgi:tetrahydromethanopterin S-methyltransferase subunit A